MFSRWMPPIAQHPFPRKGWIVLGTLAACAGAYLVLHPVGALVATAAVGFVALVMSLLDLRLLRLARTRAGDDIGTFARALDRRAPEFDPWVVRAVWDALSPWTSLRGGQRLPLRPDDVIADLGCVGSDVDEVYVQAATRARRSTTTPERNPYFGRVRTVGDMVRFITNQPHTPAP
jgi:hypothetical protein